MMVRTFARCFVIALAWGGSIPPASTVLRSMTPLLTVGALVAFSGAAGRAQIATEHKFAFAHVNVVDVERGVVRDDQTVVVAGNRLAEVGPADRVTTPAGTQVVDARGKFLIPGLWDMHAHGPFSAELFVLHAAHGVTGIRHMAGPLTEATAFRSAGPDALREYPMRIRVGAMSGPGLDSFLPYPQFPGHWLPAMSPEEARRGVAAVHAAHMDFVKIHDQMTAETWRAAVAEARKLGIPFAGHVPYAVSPAEAADAGQKSIEHLTGVLIACSSEEDEIRRSLSPLPPSAAKTAPRVEAATGPRALATFSRGKCEALARRFARAGTWHVPTFVATDPDRCCLRAADDPRARYLPDATRQWWEGAAPAASPDADRVTPRRMLQKRLEIVGMFHRLGVPLLAGTDAPIPWVYPGLSLHDELGWLVRAGLTPAEALRTATLNPARFLDRTEDFGTVARGKLADLVLLDANPLRDIANTRTVRAVVLDGELFDDAAIRRWLDFVADRARRTDVRSFDSGDVPINYVDRGSGEPVLLLHGFTRSFKDWEAGLIPQLLADGFRVIAYDARGHGASGKPAAPEQYGQEDVNDAIRLLDHLGIDSAHIVGYSRGASIAGRIVAQRPRRARSVVFGGWGTDNPVQKLNPSECESAAVALERGEPPTALLRAVMTPGTAPPLPPLSAAGAVPPVEARRSFAAALRSDCRIRQATIEDLDAAHVPAVAIVGDLDGMLPAVKAMAARMPGLKVVVLPNANHLTAGTGFVEAAAAFLREQRAPKK